MTTLLRLPSKELSRDAFLETYGPITPRKTITPSSSGAEIYCSKNEPHCNHVTNDLKSTDSNCKTICDECSINNNNTLENNDHICKPVIQLDGKSPKSNENPKKKSIHTIASRIARKSINIVSRKSSFRRDEPSNSDLVSPRWNAMFFRRSNSVSQPTDNNDSSTKALTATTSMPERSVGKLRDVKILSRSSSYVPITSSPKKKLSNSPKRYSIKYPSQWRKERTNSDIVQSSYSKTKNNSTTKAEKTELSSEYEEIRKNEEIRMIAVVTLLKRRKNSLKLKCAQFEKDLESNEELEKTIINCDVVKRRLRHMQKKLKVVNQCLSEEQEAMKVTNAKLELKQKLDQFKREISRDITSLRHSSNLSSTTSYETLHSVDEISVFDPYSPALSTMSLDHKSPDAHHHKSRDCMRQVSAPVTPSSPYKNLKSYLERTQNKAGRSMSIDCAMTSDCDSGFDNGDSMSRSNVSLDQDLAKSPHPLLKEKNSAEEKRIHSAFSSHSTFSSQSSLDVKEKLGNKKCWKNSNSFIKENDDVDKEVLDQIKEFEQFAEKTLRRLSKKGTLIPLKKDS